MTENEAKKILEWLRIRWAKKLQHFYKTEKATDIVVKMPDKSWFVRYDNALELEFEVVYFGAYNGKQFENALHYNSRLICEIGQTQLEILKVKSKSKSQFADFLEYAFNKNDIWVEGWEVHGVNFIDAGESLEEIKVKMDLEDFNG